MRRFLLFSGRATRAEWWAVNLAGLAPYSIAWAVLPEGHEPGFLVSVVFAAVLVAMSSVFVLCSVRRLHDRDKHGAWLLLNFLPYVGGPWLLLECGILPGTEGPTNTMRQNWCRNRPLPSDQ
jgi:uncharacterized membrane protein YhaH (DUF805 family)